jgi:hypothetical protein
MPMDWLLSEIGNEKFISTWPEIRKRFDEASPFDRTVRDAWDAIWGAMAAGDSQYPVISEISSIPRMRREVLRTVVQNPGITIYDLAKRLQRDYSRVLKDVRLLADMGEIEIIPDPGSVRKAKQLLPIRSINSALIKYPASRA